ncbi:MAG: WD40/YVTN/BNR-like repeat-containing protein [Candidatus Dormibacteria bacterium]
MLTAETGWAQRSLDGTVLHTTQGVQHWLVATPQLSEGQRIVAVAFVGASGARALTAGGLSSNADAPPVSMTFTSWATDDGGTRWSRGGSFSVVQDPGLSWQGALDFVNADDGWFSANQDDTAASLGTTLFRTVDGGVQWEVVAHLVPTPSPGSTTCYTQPTATFASPTTGWLTGGGCATAQFEVTHNGGTTWSPQPIPLLSTPYLGLESPTFITSQDGVMLGTPASEAGVVVYLTLNGGRSWAARDAPGSSPHAVDFINADDIWLLSSDTMNAGFAAGLYVTHDGGQLWSTLQPLDSGPPPPGGFDFNGSILDFVSTTLGWTDTFIGNGNDILQTADGGHTWKRVTVQITGSS